MNLRPKGIVLLLAIMFGVCLMATAYKPSFAGEYRELHQHGIRSHGQAFDREEGPSKASGTIAAWLFGIANLPVVLSILLRTSSKAIRSNPELCNTLKRLNAKQKKYLMQLHYWLNPVAAGVAIFHFSHSECKSTFFPELALGAMIAIILLGLLMTFKLSPAAMRKPIFKFHTSPILFVVVVSILLIGHSMVD